MLLLFLHGPIQMSMVVCLYLSTVQQSDDLSKVYPILFSNNKSVGFIVGIGLI